MITTHKIVTDSTYVAYQHLALIVAARTNATKCLPGLARRVWLHSGLKGISTQGHRAKLPEGRALGDLHDGRFPETGTPGQTGSAA